MRALLFKDDFVWSISLTVIGIDREKVFPKQNRRTRKEADSPEIICTRNTCVYHPKVRHELINAGTNQMMGVKH